MTDTHPGFPQRGVDRYGKYRGYRNWEIDHQGENSQRSSNLVPFLKFDMLSWSRAREGSPTSRHIPSVTSQARQGAPKKGMKNQIE
jgi:hypothetical protein